jgi:hypothetical protein
LGGRLGFSERFDEIAGRMGKNHAGLVAGVLTFH